MSIGFGSKAETLAALAPRLVHGYCLPQVAFDLAAWRGARDRWLAEIASKFGGARVIVRSSARSEDTVEASNAGAYLSVPDLEAADARTVGAGIDDVFASYGEAGEGDQVLVQPMLDEVRLAGVLFSRDLSTHGPYYVFNYDDRSGATDSVTSGSDAELSTYVRFRGSDDAYPDEQLARIFAVMGEIEALLGDLLEVELAVDGRGGVCVFQTRPMPRLDLDPPDEAKVGDWLLKASKKIEKLSRPHPHLRGHRSIFGVMPDWNPAEIIGVRPRSLALTLYKELVTDNIWAYMRDNYGYRNLRSYPLLISFLGVPYIDVRVSFNSFVPKGVSEALAHKLVDHYVQRLVDQPHSHDKVEFDIVLSCIYPGVREDAERLQQDGFEPDEVEALLGALRAVTLGILHPEQGLWRQDTARIEELQRRQQKVLGSPMSSVDRIYWLLEDCKRYGTLPFSGLARAGFVAMQFLRGFVRCGIFTRAEYDAYLESLDTVANRLRTDVAALHAGDLGRDAFLGRYGHLRPGTYDILSPRYDEGFEVYFGEGGGHGAEVQVLQPFTLSEAQREGIEAVLAAEDLSIGCDALMHFIGAAIEGREHAKLVFTKSLSDALVELERLGAQCGLVREELSHLNIRVVQQLYASLDAQDLRDVLLRDIEANQAAYEITRVLKLPDLLLEPSQVFHFFLGRAEPNFVTMKSVAAEVVREAQLTEVPLAGRIVCLRAADPGYDWLFSRNIAGLVTQFGGANSHMAIRAAEQGIPAVIGAGERNVETWSQAEVLEIDCANRVVRVLR
jgi:phosphohistidine swiveling domain-containing protein